MEIKAFAKINLTLDVTGKRADGYHTLDTVMQTISLWDTVRMELSDEEGVRLKSNRAYLPGDDRNTAVKAAKLFFRHCGISGRGLEISLKKRIPSRAGLGGGSADAAAVLRGLNEMFGAGLSPVELGALGAAVGADVPFCVAGGTCRCTGIGEELERLPDMPECFLAICKPPTGMSTPRAYALLDEHPVWKAGATGAMAEALHSGDLRRVAKCLSNRFDETMKLMQVQGIKKAMLSAGALGAMMTGSGSAVYGIFDTEEKAAVCAELLSDRGEVFTARPIRP